MEGRRFVGIDLGKRCYEACAFDTLGTIMRWNGKTDLEGRKHLAGKLVAGDIVALEAGSSVFSLTRLLNKVEDARRLTNQRILLIRERTRILN